MDLAPVSPPGLEPAETYSLPALLADVYAAPIDVFNYVKSAPVRAATWLVPLILGGIMTTVYMMIAYSQPGVLRTIHDSQEAVFQKKIAAGQMTQEQADKAEKIAARFVTPTVLKLFSSVAGLAATWVGTFLVALVLWLAARFVHHASVGYMKVVEVCALAGMIELLQKILRSILVVWKGNLLVTVSPTLFMDNPSVANRHDDWLSLLDPIEIWWVVILSLGLSKVASIQFGKALLWVGGFWYAFRAAMILMTTK